MKPISPTLLAALAVTLLTSSAVCAADAVRRIDHPNGPATYVTAPAETPTWVHHSGPTIGVFAGERSVGHATRAEASLNDSESRPAVVIQQGRGQTLYVPAQR